MRALQVLCGVVIALFLAIALTFAVARFLDGPLAIIPGGPLTSGETVPRPVADWSFAKDVETIELQLSQDESSRTVWILVTEGRAFVPVSLGFPPGKTWHLRAEENGQAIVRILGKRYPVTLTRRSDPTLDPKLVAVVREKYGGGPPSDAGVWFFEVESSSP